jgi:hypothetical protein
MPPAAMGRPVPLVTAAIESRSQMRPEAPYSVKSGCSRRAHPLRVAAHGRAEQRALSLDDLVLAAVPRLDSHSGAQLAMSTKRL